MSRIVPAADVDRMVELYQIGFTLSQVARLVHWSTSCVYRNLLVRGVELRSRGGGPHHPRKLAAHHVTLTVHLYRQGLSLREVGQVMGLAATTVQYRLRQAGEPIRSAAESNRLRWQRIPKVHTSERYRTAA